MYSDKRLERYKAEAMLELGDDDDEALGQLWNRVYATFDQWKQEHGNRKPKAFRGLLSDFVGPKSIPFKQAAPWQCADFLGPPSPIALAMKLFREDYAPFRALTRELGIRKVLALLIVGFGEEAGEEEADEAMRLLNNHASIEVGLREGIRAERESRRKNLKLGPQAAAEKRTEKKNEKRPKLVKAIEDLFDKPDKPGWNMTNDDVTEFLMKHGGYGYAKSTVLAGVKKIAATYRKKAREKALAQCATR